MNRRRKIGFLLNTRKGCRFTTAQVAEAACLWNETSPAGFFACGLTAADTSAFAAVARRSARLKSAIATAPSGGMAGDRSNQG
jgi:hypothetical protein